MLNTRESSALTFTSTTSGVSIFSMMSCAMRSPSWTKKRVIKTSEKTQRMRCLTLKILIRKVEEQHKNCSTIVRVNHTGSGVDHKF